MAGMLEELNSTDWKCSGMLNFLMNVEILHAKLPLQLCKDKQLQSTGAQDSPSPGEGFLFFPCQHIHYWVVEGLIPKQLW